METELGLFLLILANRHHIEVHQMNNGPYRGLSSLVYFNMVIT